MRQTKLSEIVQTTIASICISLAAIPGTCPAAAEPTTVTLATATPGGGFPLYGDAVAEVINAADASLKIITQNTKGSTENIELLERGAVDLGLVAGVPAYELFSPARQPATRIKVIAAMYADFGVFAVRGDSAARSVRDLIGKPVAWGTRASGLTALGQYAMSALELGRDTDFKAVFVEKAGDAPGLLASGEVAAIWGGGLGWPNFIAVTRAGGRLVGFSTDEVQRIVARHPFLKPRTVPPGSYPGQSEPVQSVASWSFIVARGDLADEVAYRFVKALYAVQGELANRLPQARDTTLDNTVAVVPRRSIIHGGVARYLAEAGK